MAHALLSPSSASQWLTCTPAPRLCEGRDDSSSSFADEGTLAHAYAEAYLRYHDDKIGRENELHLLESHEHAQYYSAELESYAEDFANYVLELCKGNYVLKVEQKLDLREWVPEGFGTGDGIVVKDGVLHLCDLKYGKGVKVSSVENKQLMIYGLGCISKYSWAYDFHTIRLHIYQPRVGNISVWSISVEDLLRWAEEVLKPKAEMAFKGEGDTVPGEHCRFCKIKAECRAFSELALEHAKEDFRDPKLLSIEEIGAILPKISIVEMYTKAIQEFAYARLLGGEKVPGYKLVKGKSVRAYTDTKAIEDKLIAAGYARDTIIEPPVERKLLGLTALEKVLKKKQFTELVGEFITIKDTKPAMAPESDKRDEYSPLEADFAEALK